MLHWNRGSLEYIDNLPEKIQETLRNSDTEDLIYIFSIQFGYGQINPNCVVDVMRFVRATKSNKTTENVNSVLLSVVHNLRTPVPLHLILRAAVAQYDIKSVKMIFDFSRVFKRSIDSNQSLIWRRSQVNSISREIQWRKNMGFYLSVKKLIAENQKYLNWYVS